LPERASTGPEISIDSSFAKRRINPPGAFSTPAMRSDSSSMASVSISLVSCSKMPSNSAFCASETRGAFSMNMSVTARRIAARLASEPLCIVDSRSPIIEGEAGLFMLVAAG
jgi:hypothetical protein